ncbi:MAG: Eco57I restriction-modification methylase domain-containing protein, partial [Methanobacteriaceae archaeon]|nr:Eco57I restriction-modification methylase domain-containing protein [Methanobacteriaceae archaeon]
MDKQSAETILNETFLSEFDINKFGNFIKELFNDFRLNPTDMNRYIPTEYTDFVEAFDSLGTYMDDSKNFIQVFAVGLKRTSSRDRARTMQRNLIAKFLEKNDRDAALVAFYGDEPEDWRFSFVKMEYELVKENGKVKTKTKLTPAKRSSYLVGLNEPNHTCRSQFLDLIREEDTKPTLEQIEASFGIESVTKEFFTEYKKLFIDLKESLEDVIKNDPVIEQEFLENNILTTDFAKKLLGQIVFIYFLQKKGWLGVSKQNSWGEGPKNFLRKLFDGEMGSYDNFFNDILEPLFYEALATERDGDYYSKFDCRIPFLNGGLFEPANDYDWVGTDITLDNKIFKKILHTFDLFNFTIKEDEPLEKEVAVDPEMLGKVFENLLEVIDRKSKGAFYTPREIVHYMCQQSLINYLKTNLSEISQEDIEYFIQKGEFALDTIIKQQEQKKKYGKAVPYKTMPESIKENSESINQLLKDIKVVDPAVGSGAFPVGMMNEIVRARSILSILSEIETKHYILKRETIENCLYGVDIDSSAVDITKLRFWLSLVVDEENIQDIKPLPNLDHKIMCGNSLIEEFEGMKLFDETVLEVPKIKPELERINAEKKHLLHELELLQNDVPKNIDRITEIDNQISKLRKKAKNISSQINNRSQANLFASDAQIKLKKLKEIHELFFNAESPNKKKKLRKEIENIEWEFIEETLKGEGNEKAIEKLQEYKKNKSKPFFLWKLYFAEIFRRDNPGFDIVIANPPYVRMELITEFKPYFKRNYQVFASRADIYTYFFEKGLNILRKNGILTFICSNKFTRANYGKSLRKLILKNELKIYDDYPGIKIFDDATVDPCTILIKKGLSKRNNILVNREFMIPQNRFSTDSWDFDDPIILDLRDIIKTKGKQISIFHDSKIMYGVKTGYMDAFIIDDNDMKCLIGQDIKCKEIIRSFLRGRDVRKWKISPQNLHIILVEHGKGQFLEKEYPVIYKYLNQYSEKLKNRGQVKNGQHHWLELDNNPSREFLNEFENEKIIWAEIAESPQFTVDSLGYYCETSNFIMNRPKDYDLYYIVSLLNSILLHFQFNGIAS